MLCVLPAVIMAVWAAFYVVEASKVLEGPYYGATFSYTAAGGRVTGRAEKLQASFAEGRLRADGVTLIGPSGVAAGYARLLTIRAPLPWTRTPAYAVNVVRADATLERRPDRRWSFEDFLPVEPIREPTETPYIITVKDSNVRLLDRSIPGSRLWRLSVTSFEGVGYGRRFSGSVNGVLYGAGPLRGVMDIGDEGVLFAQFESPGIHLAPVRAYLVRMHELRDVVWLKNWTADEAYFSGRAQLERTAGSGGWQVRGQGSAWATNLIAADRRFNTATFEGAFSDTLAVGRFAATAAGLSASATGSIRYGKPLRVRLDGQAQVQSVRAVGEMLGASLLPAKLQFLNAAYRGSFSWTGTAAAAGDLQAARLQWGEYDASAFRGRLLADQSFVRLQNATGQLLGARPRAEIAIRLGKEPRVFATATAEQVDLKAFPRLPKDQIRGGKLNITMLVAGPIDSPRIFMRGEGRAQLVLRDATVSAVRSADVRFTAELMGNNLQLLSAELAGPTGVFRGQGSVDLRTNALRLAVTASNVEIGELPSAPATGTGYAEMNVTGTLERPVATGFLEVYSALLEEFELPLFSSTFIYRGERLLLSDIDARSGVSQVTGAAEIELSGARRLSGRGIVQDLSLGGFTEGAVQGLAAGAWTLAGTADDPVVEASVTAGALIVDRLAIDSARAQGTWRNGVFQLQDFVTTVGGGEISATGTYSTKGASGIQLNIDTVPAAVLQPYLQGSADLGGVVSGSAEFSFLDGDARDGAVNLSLRDITINEELIGSGFAVASLQDRIVRLESTVGTLERYISLENAVYDIDERTLAADVNVFNTSMDQIRAVADRYLDDLDFEQRVQLDRLDGLVSIGARISAQRGEDETKLYITSSDFTLTGRELTFAGSPLGSADVAAAKRGNLWTFSKADLSGGPISLRLTDRAPNTIEEGGDVNLDGELYNIDLAWLVNISPKAADLAGTVDVPFRATGPASSPVIVASVNGADIRYGEIVAKGLDLGPIHIQEGRISAEQGNVIVQGFPINLIEARAPFRYPFEIPADGEIVAKLIVPERDLKDLKDIFGGLDVDATEGRLYGTQLVLSGTRDNLRTDGSIALEAKRLKFTSLDQALQDVKVEALLAGSKLQFSATGASTGGGGFETGGSISFQQGQILFSEGTFLNAQKFVVAQRFGDGIVTRGAVDADIKFLKTSPESELLISGRVSAAHALLDLGGEFATASRTVALPVNPRFDIALALESALIKSGPLEATTRSDDSQPSYLRGTLAEPDINMNFVVAGGEITLPTARIRIQSGAAKFAYAIDWTGLPQSSLVIDLQATTRIVATSGFNLERYDVNLDVSGDVLKDEQLQIRAQSDPPGLSEQEILAILGQQRVFEDVAGVAFSDFETQLKTVLSSVAAPALLGRISRDLERSLGLDYLAIDFSEGGLGSFTVAKALGNGFTLEYRRVLEAARRLDEPLEEIRLTYRLPTLNPILGRLTFALAADREGLLKLSITYSKRF